ncbi:hypothetical protein SAMD00019534_123760, partial [Acytostelium subglobosum LB1]|uniref:hypothetical protein n=1 Tax=Acytostelium subglobosum LB1 TaxID=1410327 RepID=UPI0006449EAF
VMKVLAMYNPKPKILSRLLFKTVGRMVRLWQRLNRFKLHDWDRLHTILDERMAQIDINEALVASGKQPILLRPLITVANHTANLDDPLMWGGLPTYISKDPRYMRWTLAASNVCFTNLLYSYFFTLGKCINTFRGNGIYQDAVDFSIDRLSEGQWIHIFPESKVNQKEELLYFKWGIGRLVAESKLPPIILPIYHRGFEKTMPLDHLAIPRINKDVDIFVGEPFDCDDLHRQFQEDKDIDTNNKDTVHSKENDLRKKMYYKSITTRIETEFKQLQQESLVVLNARGVDLGVGGGKTSTV